jgi:UDP-N-acetylmuramate dehydrogenase
MKINLDISERVPLKELTTFRVGGPCRYLIRLHHADEIPDALAFAQSRHMPVCPLGGGSNLLFSDAGYDGVVLLFQTHGIERVAQDGDAARIRVAAGHNWDDFVQWVVDRDYWGVENLSLIPGSVGAVPIQNVGAYGQEVADTIESVRVWDRAHGKMRTFDVAGCAFGYRASRFKHDPDRWLICEVTFRLPLTGVPVATHPAVVEAMRRQGFPQMDARRMRAIITALRTDGRLPDLKQHGNAGSFFKNAVLDAAVFARMLERAKQTLGTAGCEQVQRTAYTLADGSRKVSAATLIRLCGMESAAVGGARMYAKNPIVIVNESGHATAADITRLAGAVIEGVRKQTGVELEIEPRQIGF